MDDTNEYRNKNHFNENLFFIVALIKPIVEQQFIYNF